MKDDQRKSLRAALPRNLSWTFPARSPAPLIAVAAPFITARAPGPAGRGVLAPTESRVRLADLLLRLEPWQAVIRHGARI